MQPVTRGIEVRYIEPADPMWEEHKRIVDASCTCDYTQMRNGLWKTIAIRRDVDDDCPIHGKNV